MKVYTRPISIFMLRLKSLKTLWGCDGRIPNSCRGFQIWNGMGLESGISKVITKSFSGRRCHRYPLKDSAGASSMNC